VQLDVNAHLQVSTGYLLDDKGIILVLAVGFIDLFVELIFVHIGTVLMSQEFKDLNVVLRVKLHAQHIRTLVAYYLAVVGRKERFHMRRALHNLVAVCELHVQLLEHHVIELDGLMQWASSAQVVRQRRDGHYLAA
jgi:hypothetical protein